MRAPRIIVQIRRNQSLEVTLIEYDNRVEKFSTKRADDSFDVGVLPWRSRRGDNLVNPQAFEPSLNPGTVDPVAIAQQIARSGIEEKRFDNLLGAPLSRRKVVPAGRIELPT